ncbi:helix-turn-helix domain-containing protein [Bradyrhizobium sp.]
MSYAVRIMDHSHQQPATPTIGGDILHGADGIAAFLYGNEKFRRKIYNLVETKRLPHFRLGNMICARKSVLLAWIKAQEETSNTQVVS